MLPKINSSARSSASEMLRTLFAPVAAKRVITVQSSIGNTKARLRPAARPEPHCRRIDANRCPRRCVSHQFYRKPAKDNQARCAGEGRYAQILTRSVLACVCAPRAASALPLPAHLVRLIPCCLPRQNSCEPMHRTKSKIPLLNLCSPIRGFASGFWFDHFVSHKGD